MKCAYCNHDTKVVDKREAGAAHVTRRRRECLTCQRRFTTYERVEEHELMVVKKDGRREKFSPEKLMKGLARACEKRPVSMEQLQEIVAGIEVELRKRESQEVPSKKIGEMVIRKLKNIDPVAYIRFASVYREFDAPEMFELELRKLVKQKEH